MFLRLAHAAGLAAAVLACNWAPTDNSDTEGTGTTTAAATTAEQPTTALPPPGPEDIVVATYNVHLFFDTQCDSGDCNNGAFEQTLNDAAFAARADTIAAAIAGLEADIVMLQEVEKDVCLQALSQRLPQYTTAYLGEKGFPASIDTAILARYPLLEIRSHGDVPIPLPNGGETYFAREFLEAHFDRDGRRVIAFVGHFKSKADDDPERRLAEAGAARDIIDAAVMAYPDALVIMGGDLNDIPGSPPLLELESGGGLARVAADLGNDDWTYVYSGDLRALDHLYVSTVAAGGTYVERTARVLRGTENVGWGDSDHAALRATFRVGN